ncbi:Uncharacterised protein [Mycobacteroides abscessus subsp. abscessus]|nr:Uncharacterised protein [Mycobacteroides abscessus subsp. abscessus]
MSDGLIMKLTGKRSGNPGSCGALNFSGSLASFGGS